MISSWVYRPVGRRDPRLDWLRGYALFVMIADHVGGPASLLYPIYPITGKTRYYTSAVVFETLKNFPNGKMIGELPLGSWASVAH